VIGGQRAGQGRHQLVGAEVGRRVVGVPHAEEGGPTGQGQAAALGLDHAARVTGVLLRRVEVDAAHRVLHVELILDPVGDRLRVADDQQVVGHVVRVGRAGARAVAGEEFLL
jgi:hypothetical protein